MVAVLFFSAARAAENPSLLIHLNTVGYLPDAEKRASIAAPCSSFTVVRVSDNATIFSGKVTGPVLDADTKEQLGTADFSAVTQPGQYQLVAPGVGMSAPLPNRRGCLPRALSYGDARVLFVAVRDGGERDLPGANVFPRGLSYKRRLAGLCGGGHAHKDGTKAGMTPGIITNTRSMRA